MTRLYPLDNHPRPWRTLIRQFRRLSPVPRDVYRLDNAIPRWIPPWGAPDTYNRLTELFMLMATRRKRHPCDEHRLQVRARRRKVRR